MDEPSERGKRRSEVAIARVLIRWSPMKTFSVPICTITFNAATRSYGYSTRFEGKPAHDQVETFARIENALEWVDPHSERIWEPASDVDEAKILISRAYLPGSVPWRCQT